METLKASEGRTCIDTSIVSDPASRAPDARLLERLGADGAECAISAPVWHELTFGCRRLPRGQRRAALEAYLEEVVRSSFPILPYDEVAATWHGSERARLEALGKPAPYVDGQIAAITLVNELVMVAANTKDFARFKGLKVENWMRKTRDQ